MYVNVIDVFFEVYVDMDKEIIDFEIFYNLILCIWNIYVYILVEICVLELI